MNKNTDTTQNTIEAKKAKRAAYARAYYASHMLLAHNALCTRAESFDDHLDLVNYVLAEHSSVTSGNEALRTLVLIKLGCVSERGGAEELYPVLLCKAEYLLTVCGIGGKGLIYVHSLGIFERLFCIREVLVGIRGRKNKHEI